MEQASRMTDRPLILLSNDDGIQADGLAAAARSLEGCGEVWVVAPDRERSAISHAITLDRPLRVTEVRPRWLAVSGTPADSVYLATLHLLPRRPDLVVSGINNGYNLGSDVFYSGTVAAAVEGAVRGGAAFAVSIEWQPAPDFTHAARFAASLAREVLARGLPTGTLLNVNLAGAQPRGYTWTRLGRRVYREQIEERVDLRGKRYFWIGGPAVAEADAPGTDCEAVRCGLVSVTPLDLDLTSRALQGALPEWRLDGFEAVDAPRKASAAS
jgi:5'-nucleotidase